MFLFHRMQRRDESRLYTHAFPMYYWILYLVDVLPRDARPTGRRAFGRTLNPELCTLN